MKSEDKFPFGKNWIMISKINDYEGKKILNLSPQERKKGVIAMSAGNHAQGVSLACKLLKIKAIIVMPNNTPFEKIRRNLYRRS